MDEINESLQDWWKREIEDCTCQECGKIFTIDVLIPNRLWEQIKPEGKPKGGGLLCGSCIMKKIEELSFQNTFNGTALKVRVIK